MAVGQKELEGLIGETKKKRLRRMVDELFRKTSVDRSLAVVCALARTVEREDISQKKRRKALDLLQKIRKRFTQLPDEKIGEALKVYREDLVEQQGRYSFYLVNILLGTGKGEGERTKRIIDILLRLALVCPLPEPGREKEHQDSVRAWFFLLELIAISNVTFTWENLICLAKNNDEEAQKLLEQILFLFHFYGKGGIEFVPCSQWFIASPFNAIEALGFDNNIVCLPVPDNEIPFIKTVHQGLLSDIQEREQELLLLANWFGQNLNEFEELFRRMWLEIKESPRYGIRSEGQDLVKIELLPLRKTGYRYLQFYSEGFSFPTVKARFLIQVGDNSYSLTFILKNPDLADYVVSNDYDRNSIVAIVDQLLAFVALHCYWRIVTGKNGVPAETGQRRRISRKSADSSLSVVRPHFRRLPSGFRPSPEAADRSLAVFQNLPPTGFTFVREHQRGLAELDSVNPLFSYTEKDIGYCNNG